MLHKNIVYESLIHMNIAKNAFSYDAKHVLWEFNFVSIIFHPIIYCYTKQEIIEHDFIFVTVASAF